MVSKRTYVILIIVLGISLILTACAKAVPTVDPSAKITEIASTVQAELTLISALTPSATPTVEPTFTPTMTFTPEVTPTLSTPLASPTSTFAVVTQSGGDNAQYVDDITVDDYSMILPGVTFKKTWAVLNSGTTTWTKDYQLIYIDGTQTTVLSVKLAKEVKPGETVEVTIDFVAPTTVGPYVSWWQMYSAAGYPFGEQLSLRFNVGTDTLTPTSSTPSTPTATPTIDPLVSPTATYTSNP